MKRLLGLISMLAVLLALTAPVSAASYHGASLTGPIIPAGASGRTDLIKIMWGTAAPSGTCGVPGIYVKSDGSIYGCNAGSWTALSATSTTPSFTTITVSGAATLGSVSSAGTGAFNAVTSVTSVAATTAVTAGTSITATTTVKGTTGVLAGTAKWTAAAGVPGGSCAVGDLYTNQSGSTNTTLYVCTATNTWTAK